MTELRLPAELELRLQQEAESLELSAGDFVQMLLNTWEFWRQPAAEGPDEDFAVLLAQARRDHQILLSQAELWI